MDRLDEPPRRQGRDGRPVRRDRSEGRGVPARHSRRGDRVVSVENRTYRRRRGQLRSLEELARDHGVHERERSAYLHRPAGVGDQPDVEIPRLERMPDDRLERDHGRNRARGHSGQPVGAARPGHDRPVLGRRRIAGKQGDRQRLRRRELEPILHVRRLCL